METDDTPQGGESLSIDQAAAAYAKTLTTEAIPKDDAEAGDEADGTTTDDELQTPDDDGASDETDGETAEQDDAAESDDDEPDSEQGRFVADNAKVRLADGTVTTVHELKRGNLREADYTRKRQEDAALSSETATEREALKASKQQVEQERDYMVRLVKSIIPEEPDPALYTTDPFAFGQQEIARKQWMKHLEFLEQQGKASVKEREAKAAADENELLDREWKALIAKAPAMAEKKSFDKFVDDLKEHAPSYGIDPKDMGDIVNRLARDHREVLFVKDALSWRKLQASKAQVAKKVEGRPPVQKGGKRLNPGDRSARAATDAMTRAKAEPSVENVTAAYLASLNKG